MTKIFNLTMASAPLPGPNFLHHKGENGKSTGRHTFTLVRGAMAQPANINRFAKGTAITSLDTTLPGYYSFLKIVDTETQDLPGGFEEVTVELSGPTPTNGSAESDRDHTYSSDCTLIERCILSHPKFKDEVSFGARRAIAQIYNGIAHGVETVSGASLESVEVINNMSDEVVENITDTDTDLRWYTLIFIEGHRTYRAPHYEWQKSSANAGGLTDGDLTKLGKIDDNPDGSPPEPDEDGGKWLKTRAADSRSEGSASKDEHWEFGSWPTEIYG